MTATTWVSLTMIYPDIVSALLRAVLDGPLSNEEETTVRDEPAGDRGREEKKKLLQLSLRKRRLGTNGIIPPRE